MNEPTILELEEVWRPVVGYEGHYSVSSLGRVRAEAKTLSRRSGTYNRVARIMRPASGKKAAYQSVRLTKGEGQTTHYVHHLVLIAFVGPRPVGMDACHGDGNPRNNRETNLRWGTPASNHADKRLHGTATIGEKHPGAKLNAAAVLALRKRVADGAAPSAIGEEFGVSRMTAYRAATGRSWSHL